MTLGHWIFKELPCAAIQRFYMFSITIFIFLTCMQQSDQMQLTSVFNALLLQFTSIWYKICQSLDLVGFFYCLVYPTQTIDPYQTRCITQVKFWFHWKETTWGKARLSMGLRQWQISGDCFGVLFCCVLFTVYIIFIDVYILLSDPILLLCSVCYIFLF